MLKTVVFLAVWSFTIGFFCHTVSYADITNDVYFSYPNGDIALQSVGPSSNAFANWSNLQGCPVSTSRGTVIGYATSDEAEEETEYNVSYYLSAGEQPAEYSGTISCIRDNESDQSSGDLHYNSDDNFHIDCGRTDSHHVAAAFDTYMQQGLATSSHVVHANESAFETSSSGAMANGFPTQLSFVFAVDLQFTAPNSNGDTTWYTCPNVVFGQQGQTTTSQPNWAAIVEKQAVGLIQPAATCIVSLGEDCLGLVKALFKDAIEDAIKAIIFAASQENIWWVGQSYNADNDQASFTLPPNYTDENGNPANTGNPANQYQVAIFCRNDDNHNEQTFLVFTRDGDSDKTFNIVATPPNSPLTSD